MFLSCKHEQDDDDGGGGDNSNNDILQYCGARKAKDCGIFFNFKGSGFVCKHFILNAGVSV